MGLFSGISDFLKAGAYDYVQLEANENEYTFATRNGGLLSVVEVLGTNKITSHKALESKHVGIIERLQGIMIQQGHRIQFVFTRDPHGSARDISEALLPLKKTMRRMELDLYSMLEEREEILSQGTASERCYMVIETLPSALSGQLQKRANKDRLKRAEGVGLKPGRYGQSPFMTYTELGSSHDSFVGAFVRAFTETGLMIKRLEVHDALRAIRMEINPSNTAPTWRPHLLGDKMSARMVKEDKGFDQSHLMQPNIGMQLFGQAPELPIGENGMREKTLVKLGNAINAPLLVDLPPLDAKPFTELFTSIDTTVPWRFSIVMETGNEKIKSKLATRKSFATFLKFSNSNNSLIMDACQGLIDLCNEGVVLVNVHMSACTWGKDLPETIRNKEILTQAIQAWGAIDVIEEKGDAIEAFMNTIPAVTEKYISNTLPMTLDDIIYMTPFTRPASPWKNGSLLYRTIDNKLFPYAPGSSLQTTWVDLVFAPPGMGKSVHLAASNMALILAPGNPTIPRISIIDIGFSSAAFVQLIKNALPDSKKHLAESFKIEMDPKRFMINPFDTPLGCNKPLAVDREWLINFMTALLTPANEKDGVSRLGDVMSILVNCMYEYFDVNAYPKFYNPGIDPDVDEALKLHNINVAPNESWYSIRDALFENGLDHIAALAQRHAVPNLNDATEVLANRTDIADLYKDAMYKGEPLLSYINSSIVAALRAYPILSGASIFDTGSARIMSMDLSNVAKGGSDEADKRTSIMYMLSRQVMCREFYRNMDTLNEFPEKYKAYHQVIIQKEESVPKKICLDEFHRTRNSKKVREQVIIDIREGRKFNCHVSLLSQSLEDFDSEMIEFATNIYILSKGITEDTANKIRDRFMPSNDAMRALNQYVNGPVAGEGSTLLYIGSIKGSKDPKVEHPIRLTLGPIEMWAYSTTAEDVIIRRKMTAVIGLAKSLKILAKEFPNGVKSFIEHKKLSDKVNVFNSEENEDIYDDIISDLISKYKSLI